MRTTVLRVFAVAATLAVAGCGAASTGTSNGHGPGTGTRIATGTGPQQGGSPLTSNHRLLHPLTADQVAQELFTTARVPAGSASVGTAPTRSLQTPPSVPAVSGVIIDKRWWRIAMPSQAVYSWLAHHQSPALHSQSSGSSSGPALSDNEQNIDFYPPTLPPTVNSATLTLAVVPLTAHTSAIGGYVVIVKQPQRQAVENVPLSVDSVTVVARRTETEPGKGPILGQHTITGAQAAILVRDFDQLSVWPMGRTTCPMSMQTDTATFRSGSQVWVATTGICVGVAVSLDGHPLATLNTSTPFEHDLTAALDLQIHQPIMTTTPVR